MPADAHLSVVVPLGPGETEGERLLNDLGEQLPETNEVILAVTGHTALPLSGRAKQVLTHPGRAAQMNDAARAGAGKFLWFLHADTRLPPGAVEALTRSLAAAPDALHYFGLRFHDGPAALRLNEIGVMVRSRLLGVPFGDQGFCLRRDLFHRLGGFDETAPFGEDHLLVWAARRNGVRLRRVPLAISTSGRKYAARGWSQTTFRHVRLTLRQAVPEAARLLRARLFRRA